MSNVPSHLPVGAQPAANLTDIVANPAVLDCLPAAALIAIRRQAYGLVADLERAVTERLLAGPGALSELGVLTTGRLANLWGMKDAKIREICRTGQIPAPEAGEGVRGAGKGAARVGPGESPRVAYGGSSVTRSRRRAGVDTSVAG